MIGRIYVTQLGKAYKRYANRWIRLREWLTPGNWRGHATYWALRDVSFEIAPGEAVGIIGLNGAGKSTLLKLITGTASPTEGSVEIQGRVAALLELGMGFHPDFTGRQNVMIAGQLLGISASRLRELLPEIEAFAEIGTFMDEPVRVYSSGMQVRLAFALATAVRPDVLIVDEALSVGDAYFQHKCLSRIRQFRAAGTTLILVSHDKQAIKSMCDRAILLHKGCVELDGRPEEVLDFYNALLADSSGSNVVQGTNNVGKVSTVSGTGEAVIDQIKIYSEHRQPTTTLTVGRKARFEITVKVCKPIQQLVLGYGIRDPFGSVMFGTNTAFSDQVIHNQSAGACIRFEIDFMVNLGPGSYSLQLALTGGETHLQANYEWRDIACVFSVINVDQPTFEGTAWLPPTISITEARQ